MGSTVAVLANVVFVVILLNSAIRFLGKADGEHAGPRFLACLSSLVALHAMALIYSGQFRRNAGGAIDRWVTDPTSAAAWVRRVEWFDEFLTMAANLLNPAADVGYRPNPTLVPAALIAAMYVVRWFMYLYLERPKLEHASVTGSVYWSHFCAYAATVSFLVLIAGWNLITVLIASSALLLLLLLGLASVIGDVAMFTAVLAVSGWRFLRSFAREVARGATAVAAMVRSMFRLAHAWYDQHVRTRMQAAGRTALRAADTAEKRSKAHLDSQNKAHRLRFGDPLVAASAEGDRD